MIDYEKETLDDVVMYLLSKHSDLEPDKMAYVIYVADLYHLILFGRTVLHSFYGKNYMLVEPEDIRALYQELKGKKSDFSYLSESDKQALDFSYNRSQLDGYPLIPTIFGIK